MDENAEKTVVPSPASSLLGPAAAGVTLLLSDYARYCLTERVSYHFLLTEALANSSQEIDSGHQSNDNDDADDGEEENLQKKDESLRHRVCGVRLLLECIPSTTAQLSRGERKSLRTRIQRFNQAATEAFQGSSERLLCYEPVSWPLKLNPSTRVFFAYERTRLVLIVDASPTLTTTSGFASSPSACCPLDLIPAMAKAYLSSLIDPIPQQHKGAWRPKINISILAVFPSIQGTDGGGEPSTSLLVRDYTLVDLPSVDKLVNHLETWLFSAVEDEISRRISRHHRGFLSHESIQPARHEQSSLREWLEVGDAALSTMSSEARPHLTVATDCRSVTCDSVASILASQNRVDLPLSLLYVGSSVALPSPMEQQPQPTIAHLVQSDAGGAAFPLSISNDIDALYSLCSATSGCFWDSDLLREAARTRAGKASDGSPLLGDPFFNRKRAMHPNAVQWYTLFSLSPLTPTPSSSCGKLPPPQCVLWNRSVASVFSSQPTPSSSSSALFSSTGALSLAAAGPSSGTDLSEPAAPTVRRYQHRTTFSMYVINPIRILNLLQMRVREGYQAVRYGARTNDPDRVDILFTLTLDMDTRLQYECAYKALPDHNHMVGSAQIRIYLNGESNFIQTVKQDFVQPARNTSKSKKPPTLAQQVSDRLCKMLRWIRKEDMLQSYIAPLRWHDQLLARNSPVIRRIGTLTKQQRWRHFRLDNFDCVCIGNIFPTTVFLNAFQETDNGEKGLWKALCEWSTQVIHNGIGTSVGMFLRTTRTASGKLASYCLVELNQSLKSSRVFTVSVESFGTTAAGDRLALLTSLKSMIAGLRNVRVLEKQIAPYLVALRPDESTEQMDRRRAHLENQTMHASWDLVDDDDLMPLLLKRRVEIDGFYVVEFTDSYALLAKIKQRGDPSDPGDLVQYQIFKSPDRVSVDLHMEGEGGIIFPLGTQGGFGQDATFPQLSAAMETTDKECGRALRARSNLLASLSGGEKILTEEQSASLATVLPYTSRVTISLRCFRDSLSANDVLKSLLRHSLVSMGTPQIAQLSLNTKTDILTFGHGDWFVVKYDIETMSLLHLAEATQESLSSDGRSKCFTTLTFCTISISDLYFSRQEQKETFVEEYMPVTELAELISEHHPKLYALAAYRALRSDCDRALDIHNDDFLEVAGQLDWIKAAEVVVARGSQKLVNLINKQLRQIAGGSLYFYFCGQEGHEPEDDSESHGVLDFLEFQDDSEESESSVDSIEQGQDTENASAEPSHHEPDSRLSSHNQQAVTTAPLFFTFFVDGAPATADDLSAIQKSSTLSAMVSVYRGQDQEALPRWATTRLSKLLNAYVAEQALERLRIHGAEIAEADLRLAQICLRRARDVVVSKIELQFYFSELDALVPADQSNVGGEVEGLFESELISTKELTMRSCGNSTFVLVGTTDKFSAELPYWCFLRFQRSLGCIVVKCHHPSGLSAAKGVASDVGVKVGGTCHRVNQLLLLLHMHESRMASQLIAPDDDEGPEAMLGHEVNEGRQESGPGGFECPVKFKYQFPDLFHRCAQNPVQVARTLESALHNFALSNRSHLFVYKDESGAIFYMMLVAFEGHQDTGGQLELQVRGVEEPGESVTTQLTRILTKRLMQIGLDMLSVVLTKNPRYSWKEADLTFIKHFREKWNRVDDTNSVVQPKDPVRYYRFPEDVYDLGMVLLYFRQNLCGSTFFHPLIGHADYHISGEEIVNMVFFFNNSPSKLNASLQAQSTLTAKGAEYQRLAGSGIAIIEVSLFDSHGTKPVGLDVGRERPPGWTVEHIPWSVNVPNLDTTRSDVLSDYCLCIRIDDTALQTDVLHQWLKLTLDQVLVAWTIERHIEKRQRQISDESGHREQGEKLNPGFPAILQLLKESCTMPHPAVKNCENDGVVRSSDVATMALSLLDDAILHSLNGIMRAQQKALLEKSLLIIRASRSQTPTKVRLDWSATAERRKAVVTSENDNARKTCLSDEPTDCPEYLVSCFLPELSSSKLFRDVAVEEERLSIIKERDKTAFRRSFAFILSVKRNRRVLYAYNWDPGLFIAVSSRFEEVNVSFLKLLSSSNYRLQRRALGILSPVPASFGHSASSAISTFMTENESKGDKQEDSSKPLRRRTIRQPKLIGKSVEGAAAQALAASRARASFKGTYGASRPLSGPPKSGPSRVATATKRNASHSAPSEEGQAQVGRVEREIQTRLSSSSRLLRRHSLHQKTFLDMLGPLFPLEACRVSETGADLLFENSCLGWDLGFNVLHLPTSLLLSLTSSIATAFASRSNMKVAPFSSTTEGSITAPVFIIGKFRNVRHVQCGTVIKLQIQEAGDGSRLLRCRGFNLIFVESFNSQGKTRPSFKFCAERAAAGSDKLTSDLFLQTDAEQLMFDFMAGSAGRMAEAHSHEADVMRLLDSLIGAYPFTRQLRMVDSQFKVFEVPLILKSYGNQIINQFSPLQLFRWLERNQKKRNMLQLGQFALLFQLRDVVVKGTHTVTVLTCDPNENETMGLVFMCRANGKDIGGYTLRPRGAVSVAVTVAKAIAIEGATIVYEELLWAATSLQRERLWQEASDPNTPTRSTTSDLSKLIELCTSIPLLQFSGSSQLGFLLETLNEDCLQCCEQMMRESAFQPSHRLLGSPNKWIYYLQSGKLFLLACEQTGSSSQVCFFILCQDSRDVSDAAAALIIQKVANYILHTVWRTFLL